MPGLVAEIEAAGSHDDPNTYSSLDDGDRLGGALRVRLAREMEAVHLAGHNLGRLGVDWRLGTVRRASRRWAGSTRAGSDTRWESGPNACVPGTNAAARSSGTSRAAGSPSKRSWERFRIGRISREAGMASAFPHGSPLRIQNGPAFGPRDATGETVEGRRAVEDARLGIDRRRVAGSVAFRSEETERGEGAGRTGGAFEECGAHRPPTRSMTGEGGSS